MITVLIGYLTILLIVGAMFVKHARNIESYYLAGRHLAWGLAAVSLLASWFGAASTLVTFEAATQSGGRAFWLIGAPTLLTLVMLWLLAPAVEKMRGLSIPDHLGRYYGSGMRYFSSVALVVYLGTLAGSQAIALGKLLAGMVGLSYHTALVVGVGGVLAYTVMGGFLSVVVTDGVQLAMIIGMMLMLSGYMPWPPPLALGRSVTDLVSEMLRPDRQALMSTFSFVVAWTISPIAWQRLAATGHSRRARSALMTAFVAFIGLYFVIIFLGRTWQIRGPGGMDKIDEGAVLVTVIQTLLPRSLALIALGGLISAVASTLDTAVNSAGLVITSAFPATAYRGQQDPRRLTFLATGVTGGLTLLLAWFIPDIFKVLGMSSEIITIGLAVPLVATFYLADPPPVAGWTAALTGMVFIGTSYLVTLHAPHSRSLWHWPTVVGPGLIGSLVAFCIALQISRRWPKIKRE